MTQIIMKRHGLVDKYIGDAIMALWNVPIKQERHAHLACDTALAMIAMLTELKKRFPNLNIGIGIHTGEAVVGNMGSEDRFDYTAIGDNVNLASRLEGLTKEYGVQIIISEETRKALDGFAVRKLDMVRVKGKQKPIFIYELLQKKTEEHERFEEALEFYFEGEFKKAKALFKKVNDNPSKLFLERIATLTKKKRTEWGAWEGIWTYKTK